MIQPAKCWVLLRTLQSYSRRTHVGIFKNDLCSFSKLSYIYFLSNILFSYPSFISARIPPSLLTNMSHRYLYLPKQICRLSPEIHKCQTGLTKLQFFPLHLLWVFQNKDRKQKVSGNKFLRKILGPERERERQRCYINFHAKDLVTFIFNRIARETAISLIPFNSSNWDSRVAV